MAPKDNVLTEERVNRYVSITAKALEKVRIVAPERSFSRMVAEDFLRMASAYFEDARGFLDRGELVNAFACINYAHGWLDCGARLGLFDVGSDDQLFTLYE